jgi:hypothetical protein
MQATEVRQVGWMRWDASGGSGDVQSHTLHVMHAGQVVQIERPLYPMQMVHTHNVVSPHVTPSRQSFTRCRPLLLSLLLT